MDRALWFLLWLRLRGWTRRLLRGMRTFKGAALVVLGAFMFLPWCFSLALTSQLPREQHVEQVRRYGPWGLLAYCVLLAISSGRERALSFGPAEVNFLFSGPFPRRQLLAYKIVGALCVSLFTAAILTAAFRNHAMLLTAAYGALVLALMLLQLFAMTVVLVGTSIGARLYDRRRRWIAALVIVLALAALLESVFRGGEDNLLVRLEHSRAAALITQPFRWFVFAFTAKRLWPDFVVWAGLAASVDLILIGVVFSLDAYYLETAAAAGERLHARLKRLRAGIPIAGLVGPTARRFRLPTFPWLRGAGPLAWRQLLTGGRQFGAILAVLFVMLIISIGPAIGARGSPTRLDVGAVLGSTVLVTAFFLPMLLPFDFRGDVDRFDVLKSLPVSSSAVVAGQLFAPVAILSFVQWIALAAIQLVLGHPSIFLLLAAPFALPVNWLIFAMENLVFLWFPARTAAATPGDFQAMGRQVVISFGRLAGLMIILLVVGPLSGLIGFVVYLLAGKAWQPGVAAGIVTAWLSLIAMAAGTVPILASAFRRFDVAQDTPP